MAEDSPPGPPRFRLTGTTAGPGRRAPSRRPRPSPSPKRRRTAYGPRPSPRGQARPGGSPSRRAFARGDVYSRPVIEGREQQDNAWSRLRDRLRTLATSEGERREQELEESLSGAPQATRSNTIAVASPKGGVGKTTCTFLIGRHAGRRGLRVAAVDADHDVGTLDLLVPNNGSRRTARHALPRPRPDRLRGAPRRTWPCTPAGCTCSRARPARRPTRPRLAASYGTLAALLERFYDVVLLDLGTGFANPVAQFGIRRADQALLVTTPEYVTAEKVLGALRYLNAEAGWDSGGDEESINRKRLTVVLNRAPSERSGDRQVIESAFRRFGIGPHVTIPYDDRLRVMLDSATYSLDALRRDTPAARQAPRRRGRGEADLRSAA